MRHSGSGGEKKAVGEVMSAAAPGLHQAFYIGSEHSLKQHWNATSRKGDDTHIQEFAPGKHSYQKWATGSTQIKQLGHRPASKSKSWASGKNTNQRVEPRARIQIKELSFGPEYKSKSWVGARIQIKELGLGQESKSKSWAPGKDPNQRAGPRAPVKLGTPLLRCKWYPERRLVI